MTRLVDDLLDVTRISRGKVELQRTLVDARDIVRKTCDDLRSTLDRRSIDVSVETHPGPVWIEADVTRLSQVVGNLLHNAAKFTPEGKVVTVSVADTAAYAEIRVRDEGVGIAQDLLARLFEPFVQADGSLARTKGGLGLGLALAKGIVELHGGSISAYSDGEGRGSEFVVKLPLASVPGTSATGLSCTHGDTLYRDTRHRGQRGCSP
jgi:signal transduction histidine kinase